ncbi:MAG TPA: calcium/sodium antiporter [Acidiferrobacteraceae bacterium]|nr:calcium/sodium antiporter [Acidiferrobacteraceae bacterium]
MLTASLSLVVGLALLAWGADRFVYGATSIARNFGVSPLIVGLTIVGFGTSAPELLVSTVAAWQGNTELALGNAVGSNIANIGLVLGSAALIHPLVVRSRILKREYPIMALVLLATPALLLDGRLGRLDGVLLISGLILLIAWTIHMGLRQRVKAGTVKAAVMGSADELAQEYAEELKQGASTPAATAWLIGGLLLLLGSSKLLVWAAIVVAQHFGMSDLLIGLTIVAVGTSLPEVATSIASIFKGEHDIAIGNIVGSNMFNMLGVIGIAGVIHPISISPELLNRDFLVMLVLAAAMLGMAYRSRARARIGRIEGGLLLIAYCGYLAVLAWGLQTN